MKKLAILGSTGSIGTQTLEVVEQLHQSFEVAVLAGHANWQLLLQQALKYQPKYVILTDEAAYKQFLPKWSSADGGKVLFGMENLVKVLGEAPLDLVVGAMGGAAGIAPILRALDLGIDVALANKETIVAAGDLVREAQRKTQAKILPVDSEHSAIFQCLEEGSGCIAHLLLTASGGPFREATMETLKAVTPASALKHPNWTMGRKITIDSATLMNKGLEVIEANWLFGVPYDQIKVLVHPQSVVHSMVEYGDGSILAHLGMADMRIPIQYALTYPKRVGNQFPKLDLTKAGSLTFHEPDLEKFPALALGYRAGKQGQSMPAVLNAANEIAVAAFLNEEIGFLGIARLVEQVMNDHQVVAIENLAHLMEIDGWARTKAKELMRHV